MTSILKVDTIQDTAGNNIINESGDTITIGASGDTITIPSGATTTLTDGVSGDFKMNSGYGSIATVYGCRAWVNFNGTGTVAIRASGNVTSITDNGTGHYTVNLTTAMPDANYASVLGHGFAQDSSGYTYGACIAQTASTIRINIAEDGNGNQDTSHITVAVFR
jgi:hypothetical protein